jgi:hypothetical protein
MLLPSLQIASKMDPADKSTIESAVDDAISWLDTNQLAEVRICTGAGLCQHVHAVPMTTSNCAAMLLWTSMTQAGPAQVLT